MTAPLFTPAELTAATGGRLIGAPAAIAGASIDTRTLAPGDLFFAIQGEARDGHDFVRDALGKGAAAAIVAEARAAEFAESGPVLAVPDVLAAMADLGRASRARSQARILAVTGSVGKTGTKEMLRHILSHQGETHASVASYNNHWGVPLTLARMAREAAFGVFEIGMNHPYEILPLTALVRPHAALVTTVRPAHIEFFRSLSAIADAKGEIFSGVEPGGTAIINRDDGTFERLKAHASASRAGRVVTFGEHGHADLRATRIHVGPDHTSVEARFFGRPIAYRIGTAGRHVALNSLGALGAVEAIGADVEAAAAALGDLRPPVGRGERTLLDCRGGELLLIDESYNANPASVRAALAALAAYTPAPGGRRIVVLGDMRELGPEGPQLHAALAEPIAEAGVDLVFAAGDLMRQLFDALPAAKRGTHAKTAAELVEAVLGAVRPNDAVMVKGSLSIGMGQIVEALKTRYVRRDAMAIGA